MFSFNHHWTSHNLTTFYILCLDNVVIVPVFNVTKMYTQFN